MEYANKLMLYASKMNRIDSELARRYVKLATSLFKKKNITIPNEHKIHYCKKCFSYLDATTAKYRTNNKKLIITCTHCGQIKRKILN